jgi:hypothetical protein
MVDPLLGNITRKRGSPSQCRVWERGDGLIWDELFFSLLNQSSTSASGLLVSISPTRDGAIRPEVAAP